MILQWHITDRCNLTCRHCYREDPAPRDLSRLELLQILDEWRAHVRSERAAAGGRTVRAHINLSGGEPFVREDFADLLNVLASYRAEFSFAILSNGTLINREAAAHLAAVGPRFVQISIEGTEKTHDSIRGAGSFRRAVDGIRRLVERRVRVLLSFTAHRENYREFPAVASLGRRLGVARVWSDRLIPCGGAAALKEGVLSPEETAELLRLMDIERRRRGFRRTEVAMHRALQFALSGGHPYRCTAGGTLITVLANGDLCPCRRMPVVVGNVLRSPLGDLYRSSAVFRQLRDRERVSRGCEKCFYARDCGGGLRCLSHAVYGDAFRADPGCWMAAGRPGN